MGLRLRGVSTATESKQTLAALRGAHFDQNGRDVRGKATAVLLAIGISQRGFDFHYRKKYARAG